MMLRTLGRIGWLTLVLVSFVTPGPVWAQLVWVQLADFQDPRMEGSGIEGATASLIDERIYVSKGYRSGDTTFLSIYDIPTNTWIHGGSEAPDAPGSLHSEGAGGTAFGRHYAIGGRPGIPSIGDTAEEFDPATTMWTTMDTMPTPRRGLGTGSLGDRIYAVGGSDGSQPGDGTITSALEVLDPMAAPGAQWTILSPMLVPLMDAEATIALDPAASGTVAGALYVFGGRDADGQVVSTVQIYDIATDTWTPGAPLSTPRSNAMAGFVAVGAVEDGMIAVFGGADEAFTNLAVTELYDPRTDMWIAGPPLLTPASEQAVGKLWDSTGIYAIGSGIFGASGPSVQRLQLEMETMAVTLR